MNNNEIASTIGGMLNDWESATPAQRASASRRAAIAAAEKELDIRKLAASNLSGIPKQQNATEIERLYDWLNRAHIEEIEAGS